MKYVLYKGKKMVFYNVLKEQTKRAVKLGISPPNIDDLLMIFRAAMDTGLCCYCGCEFVVGHDRFRPTLDHMIPVSRGGTNDIANLMVCCQRCNTLKRTMTDGEFRSIFERMGDYMKYAGDDMFRNRFANRFKELRGKL